MPSSAQQRLMDKYQEHPAANAIRMMDDTEYKSLKKDIAENGLIDPIVLFKGKILDGRNRYKICEELGIEPKFIDYKGKNPMQYVRSVNIKRRHLSKYELVLEALKSEPEIKAKAKERQGTRTDLCQKSGKRDFVPNLAQCKTRDEVAATAGVSHGTVEKVKLIERHATPETKEKLSKGEITIDAAHKSITGNGVPKNAKDKPTTKGYGLTQKRLSFLKEKVENALKLLDVPTRSVCPISLIVAELQMVQEELEKLNPYKRFYINKK